MNITLLILHVHLVKKDVEGVKIVLKYVHNVCQDISKRGIRVLNAIVPVQNVIGLRIFVWCAGMELLRGSTPLVVNVKMM